jgi:ribosome-associated protein
MPTPQIREQVALAVEAVNNKKAEDVALLQLPRESSTFTDYFLICSGSNPRQVQAIADEVDERLSKDMGVEPNAREGYQLGEWILIDYVDFVVHIFNSERRAYYDLERLWKSAHKLTTEELLKTEPKPAEAVAVKAPAKKAARKSAPKVPSRGGKKAAAKAPARGGKKTAAKKSGARKVVAKKGAAKKTAAKKVSYTRAAAKSARKK